MPLPQRTNQFEWQSKKSSAGRMSHHAVSAFPEVPFERSRFEFPRRGGGGTLAGQIVSTYEVHSVAGSLFGAVAPELLRYSATTFVLYQETQ